VPISSSSAQRRSTPGDTASLKADLAEGIYSVSAASGTIDPARIRVGPRRESGKDRLLQP